MSSLSGLGVGVYTLVIRDSNNCETDLSIDVKERVLTAEAIVDKPLCFGEDNGVITMNVTNGVQPIQFDFGGGFITQNFQGGFAAGTYTIQAVDEVLCKGTFEVDVTDHPVLELAVDTIDISCFTANDGMGIAIPSGEGNYTYLWLDGQTTESANDLPPGAFTVTVTDGNGCTITGSISVIEPADVAVALVDVLDLLCNGLSTGEIRVEGQGGLIAVYIQRRRGQFCAVRYAQQPVGRRLLDQNQRRRRLYRLRFCHDPATAALSSDGGTRRYDPRSGFYGGYHDRDSARRPPGHLCVVAAFRHQRCECCRADHYCDFQSVIYDYCHG